MIEEIVKFSRELEENKIYDIIDNKNNIFLRPIIVIPLDFKNQKIRLDDIFVILKKDTDDFYIEELKKNEINRILCKVKQDDLLIKKIKDIKDIDKDFMQIIKSLNRFLNRINTNTCIGGAKGTCSFHSLCFFGKTSEKGILSTKYLFKTKIEKTYKESLLENCVPNNFEDRLEYIKILSSIPNYGDEIWNRINFFIQNITKSNGNKLSEFSILFKIPEDHFSYYNDWFDFYFKKKLFAEDKPEKYFNGCYVPDTFNNLNSGKPYLRHLNRKNDINIIVNLDESFSLYKFDYYIPKLKLNFFPIFINKNYKKIFFNLIKGNFQNMSFREILTKIYEERNDDVFDFYLVRYIKKRDKPKKISGYFDIDFISGYRLFFNGYKIFDIEFLINKFFFDDNLIKNYFISEINIDDKILASLIYKYRNIIFDFIYRAKYSSLKLSTIDNMFFEIFKYKLRKLYNNDNYRLISESVEKYKKINKIFGGDIVGIIDNIKNQEKIFDLESFAYFSGQLVYYLLSLSKANKGNKNHSMVEPFINVQNVKLLGMRISDLFSAYKHCIYLNNSKFNNMYAQILAYIVDFEEQEFSNHLKMIFYAGYFNTNENFMYKSGGKNE